MNECMEKTVLSVAQELFKGKNGEPDKLMYRLYFAASDGKVGYLYSVNPHEPGNVIRLGLGERDGKLRLKVLN